MSMVIHLGCDANESCPHGARLLFRSLDELRAVDREHGWLVSNDGKSAVCPCHGMWAGRIGAGTCS